MSRYAMVIDPGRCIDCKACLVACTAENGVPVGKHRNWVESHLTGRFPELMLRSEPGQCMQCSSPPCVRVCPVGASRVGGLGGIVEIDPERCIGCRYCMQVCPYDARFYDAERGVVDKCDFCAARLAEGRLPACVETCPTKARGFGDLDDPESEVSRLLRTRASERKKVEAGTGPNVYYIVG